MGRLNQEDAARVHRMSADSTSWETLLGYRIGPSLPLRSFLLVLDLPERS